MKRKAKRLISCLLCVCMIFGLFPCAVLAESTYSVEYDNWFDSNNTQGVNQSNFPEELLNQVYPSAAQSATVGQSFTFTKPNDFTENDENGNAVAVWKCTGYQYGNDDENIVEWETGATSVTVTSVQESDIFTFEDYDPVLIITYIWTRTEITSYTVTYNFNKPDGATIYPVVDAFQVGAFGYSKYGNVNSAATTPNITTFFANGDANDIRYEEDVVISLESAAPKTFSYDSVKQTVLQGFDVTVSYGLAQRRLPACDDDSLVKNYGYGYYHHFCGLPITDFIARKTNADGSFTYYALTGWKRSDTGDIVYPGNKFNVTQNTTLTAQWKELTLTAGTDVREAPILTTDSGVKLSQKLPADTTWSTDTVTLGDDGRVDYRVTMTPNSAIYPTEAQKYFKAIDNADFAAININVTLGDGLELVTDSDGYTTITIADSMLAPSGSVTVNGTAVETKIDGNTVKAQLNGATAFTLPMKWNSINNLGKEMTLDFSAKAKSGATSGFTANVTVTGAIDLSKAHTNDTKNASDSYAVLTADQVIRYVLSGDSNWYNEYANKGITGTLQAAADLEKALKNISYTSNTLTANANYRVEHYKENVDGTYTLAETDALYGTLGTTVTATAKTYEHYQFNSSTSTTSGTVVATGNGGLTLKLYYDLDTVTVKFDSVGGTSTESKTVRYGSTVTAPDSPTKPGYTFNGWYNGEKAYDFTVPVTTDITLTAGWTERVTTTVVTTPSGNKNTTTTTTETLPTETGDTANTQVGEAEVVSTETVTDEATGTVTTTTEKSDGSTTVVETKTDGTVTTTAKAANGVEAVTVAAPGKQVTAKVTIPEDVEKATVTIPADLGSGIVAMDADTGEIIMLSVLTDDGMAIKLDGSANIVLVDNSKDFDDVGDEHWASDAVDFATSHELFNGTSEDSFSPNADMTRAMLMTVLARFDGVDTDSGSTWYEAGMNWAVENEITDGSNPDASITREQLVTMLYRYAGSPATSGKLDAYSDAANVSSYAADAMAWAVENGILNGINGALAPQSTASRAQVAAIFQRLCALLVG